MSFADVLEKTGVDASSIRLNELEVSLRLDAEYYSRKYLETEALLKTKPHESLKSLVSQIVSFGAYALTNQYSYRESGIPFIRCKDIKGVDIDFTDVLYIDEAAHKILWKSDIQPENVLLTMSGSVCNVAIAWDDLEYPINSNQDVAKITINKDKVNPYYITAFFASRYGQLTIKRLPVGSVQQHVFIWQLETLPIPVAGQKLQQTCEELLRAYRKKRKESIASYKIAEQKLLAAIGLSYYQANPENVSTRHLSDAIIANRFDAEYWQPKYDDIENKVKSLSFGTLGSIAQWKKGIEVGSVAYETEGIPFIRIGNLSRQEIVDNDQKYISPELYKSLKDDFSPHKNEILFSKDGTAGIAHRLTDDVTGIVSGGILRLTVTDPNINPDYLTVCLNSLLVQMQVERYCGGSIIQHLKTSDFEKIVVPVLDKAKQKEIADTAYQSRLALEEAKALLERAKRAVEVFIEQDEQAALKAIKDV